MRTISFILLLTLFLSGKEYLYTLPDDKNELLYDLRKELKKSEKYVYIFSETLGFQKLFTMVKRPLNSSIPVLLITNSDTDLTDKFGLFESFYSFKLKGVKSSGVLIDGKKLFLFGTAISENFDRGYSHIFRTDSLSVVKKFEDWFSRAIRRSIDSN